MENIVLNIYMASSWMASSWRSDDGMIDEDEETDE